MAIDATERQGAQAALTRGQGAATLVAVALASVMLPLAVTAPAVALTQLAAELDASVGQAQWVQNAYNVTFAAFMLAAGGLADRFGRRRILVIGVVVFMAMAAVIGLSSNIIVIDVARAVQGVGAAGILTSGAAVLADGFRGAARARAFGVLGSSFGFGLALGPLVAGVLVNIASWRAVFLMNVVLGVIVLLLVRAIRESRDPEATSVDWGGVITFSASLFLLSLAFVQGAEAGWLSLSTIGAVVGFVAFLAAFIVVESRVRRPMFDLALFRRPTFVVVVCQPFTITFGFVVLLVYLPPFFQGVGGFGSTEAGALLLPLTLPVLLLPLVAGQIAAKAPLRVMLALSSLLIAGGSLWLMVLEPGQSWTALIAPLALFGIGVGSAFGVMDNAAVSTVEVERAGMASGIFNTMRITGESVAIAGAGSLLTSLSLRSLDLPFATAEQERTLAGEATQGRLDTGLAQLAADEREPALEAISASLTSAMHTTFLGLAVLALAGAVVTFLIVKERELRKTD
ncbi:MFS transporter [Nocardiopsis sp. EMB25]|uniref:MFS transporter n=1 Tax=Nocardiopsis sp. EMB25 TaxID=2835867 RepID=UPI0022845893|nr:MFS transporter [Nocardiopsis sp. EMB25]MCY9785082.1 MFS transporter [Nocardiopsis sp. EMB25]